ncbi:MAG: hypothetical protein M3Q10_12895 [Chloroflexota bacterium]|nr:hypothetical protein [Chloroflexota bacterium]
MNDPAVAEPGEIGATASGTVAEVSGEPGPEGSEIAVADSAQVGDQPETTKRATRERALRERARRLQQAAEEAVATVDGEAGDPRTALMMPLVRHMALMTRELNEAHRALGQLGAERDALRREIAELKGLSVSEAADGSLRVHPNKEARMEAKAAKQAERLAIVPPAEIEPELDQRAAEVGRRRRLIALGVLGLIVLVAVAVRMMFPGVDYGEFGKQGLQNIAFVGPLFSLLMGGFLIYRIVRVGGKARGWLFPEPEKPRKRRR